MKEIFILITVLLLFSIILVTELTAAASALEVKIGDRFNITIPCNPSTGYNWWIKTVDYNLLQSTKNGTTNCGLAIGSGCDCFFEFKALSADNTNIKFLYYRLWEGENSSVNSYEKNITITPITTTTTAVTTTTTAVTTTTTVVTPSIITTAKNIYNFLTSINPILLLVLGTILIFVSKLARFIGIVLIIFALICFFFILLG
jgi:inhibitor of cysteine peptidase